MYTYVFMTSVRVIPVSAVLSRVPYEWLYLQKWVTPPLSRAAPQSSHDPGTLRTQYWDSLLFCMQSLAAGAE